MALLGASAWPAAADDAALREAFARYLSGGRSDVEIHLSGGGAATHARTTPRGAGSHRCDVAGLDAAADAPPGSDAAALSVRRLIHETTHCQTSPYASALRDRRGLGDDTADTADAAERLVALTLESVADARIVFELHRVDGLQAARDGGAAALQERSARRAAAPERDAHDTSAALREALRSVEAQATQALAVAAAPTTAAPKATAPTPAAPTIAPVAAAHAPQPPQPPDSAAHSFDAALRAGQAGALATWRRQLHLQGREGLADSAALRAHRAALAAALQAASHAFANGRHDNRAASIRAVAGASSAGDHHFFVVGAGRAVRTQPALGAEGAHAASALSRQVQGHTTPEARIAVQWLRCQGALEGRSLERLSRSIARVIRHFTDGTPAQTARAVGVLDATPGGCRPGQGSEALLDQAADRLKAAFSAH